MKIILVCMCVLIVSTIYLCILLYTGLVPSTTSGLPAQMDEVSENVGDIDAVFTWVDSTETAWLQLKNTAYKNTQNDNLQRWNNNMTNPDIELHLSLRLLLQNMPYVRRVYIITIRPQIPTCLHSDDVLQNEYGHNRIRIIHHDEIFESPWNMTPSFNSASIESFMHNIHGLAEQFVYLNDDTYVTQYISPSHLFNQGRAVVYGFMSKHHHYDTNRCDDNDPFWCAHHRTINLIMQQHGRYFNIHHQFKCFTKRMIHNCLSTFRKEIYVTRSNPIRSKSDITYVDLCLNNALFNGLAVIGKDTDFTHSYLDDRFSSPNTVLSKFRNRHAVCINNCNSKRCANLITFLHTELL